MSITVLLAKALGPAVANSLINVLRDRKDGLKRIQQATEAIANGAGAGAIEALNRAFGKDFLISLNEVLGASKATFSYEAGTQHYIKLENSLASESRILRDELNINLDRLTLLETKDSELKNQARGVIAVWGKRCLDLHSETKKEDIDSTLKTMETLLTGETRNFRQIFALLQSTSLGGIGALLVIAGVLLATGTGVGITAAISTFVFGIPWITVGALVLPGALLVVLAAKKSSPLNDLSISVAMAYQLLDRLERASNKPPSNRSDVK